MKLLRVFLFLGACVLLYFSSGMLLFVPGYPGEGYFAKERVLFGVVPFLASSALLVIFGRLSARAEHSGTLGGIASAFAYAISAVAVFDIGVMIVAGLFHR